MGKTAKKAMVSNEVFPSRQQRQITIPPQHEYVQSRGDDNCSSVTNITAERRRNISDDYIIRPRDLPRILGISKTTCWRLSNDPSSGFPSKVRITCGAVGYFRHQLEAWLDSRQAVGGSSEN